MPNGYRGHINKCEDYRRAIGNTWCPICMIDLQSASKTMKHLKFRHYMLDQNLESEAAEDVVIDKSGFVETARTLYPAPAHGPIPEYPNYSKHQSNGDQGYSPGEDTDTSTELTHQSREGDETNEEPEG